MRGMRSNGSYERESSKTSRRFYKDLATPFYGAGSRARAPTSPPAYFKPQIVAVKHGVRPQEHLP